MNATRKIATIIHSHLFMINNLLFYG